MKLTILGGGGFRVPLVYQALAADDLITELVLFDSSPDRLGVIDSVLRGLDLALPFTATTDLDEALTGADFVFAAIRVGGAAGRIVDERVALNLGLLGQETIGAGGLSYALRTISVMTHVAQRIAALAPQAWTINFTNPAGIVTEAMRAVLGDRVVGICDTPIGLVRRVQRVAEAAGLGGPTGAGESVGAIDYVGLNHLGWLRGLEVGGRDVLPAILERDDLLDEIEEARTVGFDWVRAHQVLPNEYLFYYLFHEDAVRSITEAPATRGEFLLEQQGEFYRTAEAAAQAGNSGHAGAERAAEVWASALREREATYMAEARDEGEERREEDVAGGGYQEVALRLMTAIARNRPERMILDVGNAPTGSGERLVPQLPHDLVLEVPCVVDGSGVHPEPLRSPVALDQLGLMARQRAAERRIMRAALTGSKREAWLGFSEHPLIESPQLGRQLLDDYLAEHAVLREILTEEDHSESR
ncbi:6-phospho-beta-glucosidase [Helcobacillus massiliensis]|uniref:6-phospho-beta-glucosidase n=1 Tax=Helcobacillus massiliensis TaxID=521392 RepID=A0A839QXL4_9MICO|nr:6-phospho-beta-glucosidase [Helcobacillus massiliensis]MBB3023570.1 6-phospho-beta-glucosidase [Helcobacillus massiliensis]